MFQVNEKVVYPGYGVAIISKLVSRQISGQTTSFYELKFFDKDMAVLIPEGRIEAVGIRRLSTDDDLQHMFEILNKPPADQVKGEIGVNNWNRRNKKYQLDLRSGDLFKLSSIYRDLQIISNEKELSFGERNLCNKIEFMLIEEIAAVKNICKEKAFNYLENSTIFKIKASVPDLDSEKNKNESKESDQNLEVQGV